MTIADPIALFDLADQLGLISSEVLRFRLKSKDNLSLEEQSRLENLEIDLDKATAKVRGMGMAAVAAATGTSRAEVQAATENAEALLRRIKKIERALDIATSVLNLALAVISKDTQSVLKALASLKNTASGNVA